MHLAEGVNRQQYSEVNQFFTSRWKRKNLENGENTLSRKIPFLFQSSYFQIGQRQVGMCTVCLCANSTRLSGKNDAQLESR